MARYPSPGHRWVTPRRKGYKMMCCDCGLVHRLEFRLVKEGSNRHVIQFRAARDKRATGQARRWRNAEQNSPAR